MWRDRVQRRTPLWLSHHYPHEYDRCIRVGASHICRRCSVFYPLAFAVMLAALAGLRWPRAADPWLLWLLPIPVVVEWWAEHLGLARYSALRNTALTLICAPAVGVGLARYMTSPGDTLFWAVVGAYAAICITPVLIASRFTVQRRDDRRHLDRRPRTSTAHPVSPEPRDRTGAGSVR